MPDDVFGLIVRAIGVLVSVISAGVSIVCAAIHIVMSVFSGQVAVARHSRLRE